MVYVFKKNTRSDEMKEDAETKFISYLIISGLIVGLVSLVGFPIYNVWSSEQGGRAELAKAEYSKQVAVEEAKADLESSTLLAQAEVERAKGVALANQIIGTSLKDNEAYLRYLWIQGLNDGTGEVVYIPTEANLPLLEARDKN